MIPPAFALGHQACRGGYHVLYQRLPKIDVLVWDDWGLETLTDRSRHDRLEILDDRYQTGPTLNTTKANKHPSPCRLSRIKRIIAPPSPAYRCASFHRPFVPPLTVAPHNRYFAETRTQDVGNSVPHGHPRNN